MKDKKTPTNEEIIDGYDYLGHAASTTDFTGLMPTPAYTPEERESYEDIYYFRPDVQAILKVPNSKKEEH